MFNKNRCRQLGKKKAPFVTLVSASRLEVRVPTVSEKQIDRIRNETKHRPQIYVGGKYKVVYIDDARQLIN